MKKYCSLIGFSILILVMCRLGYQTFFGYLSEHTYYFTMLSTGQNRYVVISALVCAGLFPITYLLATSKLDVKKLIMWFVVGAGVFGLIHSNIKGDPIGIGHVITVFNTVLLVCLGIYLILGFYAIGSWIEKKLVKFSQFRWQEVLITFGIGLCSFIIVVQILLGIGILYGIISWLLFLGLGFMIRYQREQLSKGGEIIGDILDNYRTGIKYGGWNILSRNFWTSKKIGFLVTALPIFFGLAYIYMGIQNAFTPYSTAWDANHLYMYYPKILADNAGIFWGNTVANDMPGFWTQFITFIFSLTGCTNGWFGLSPDNIAISMNNMSTIFVFVLLIAIIFQVFSFVSDKAEGSENKKSELKKGNKIAFEPEIHNLNGTTIGIYFSLLWLTGGMGAFLVIVDNKTDFGVMTFSLLALLAGFVFLQNKKILKSKKELLKYIIIAGLFFGFASLAKITAFVDFVVFGLFLVGLLFSPVIGLGLGIIVMGAVRKFNILTSDVMLTNENASRFIIIGLVITVIGFIIHILKRSRRKNLGKDLIYLITLGIGFLLPFILFKLPRTTIAQVKSNSYSIGNSLKAIFLVMDLDKSKKDSNNTNFLAQNSEFPNDDVFSEIPVEVQNSIDNNNIQLRNDKTFNQCSSIGNIYSDDELNEGLYEIVGGQGGEDYGRYIGYGGKTFTETHLLGVSEDTANNLWFKISKTMWPKSNKCAGYSDANNLICEDNMIYGIMKLLWPTSDNCYGFNHDAKVLCSNADVISSFKIDDLRAIYDNSIKNKEGDAGVLLKTAIDAYDNAKSDGLIGLGTFDPELFHEEIVNLRQYYQAHSIYSSDDAISIPYRYLVPLNISFNWSLQNLSSYYTDIGFYWIIVYILLLISLPYALIKKDKLLTSISLTTFIGRGIWRIIGSAILWYGAVLITWTAITLALFWEKLLEKEGNEDNSKILVKILIGIVGIIFGIQLLFNYIRIASQGASSVFVRYKGNVGNTQVFDDNLQGSSRTKYGYGWKNIFDLQFPQYNPIINALSGRNNKDGIIIAGTYMQYFLGNQWNIRSDGTLDNFRKTTSDGNLCKTYWRLKNKNVSYLIIDPNIGTVSMGEGNESLFYKFFGKLNSDKTKIERDGTITTLIRLYKTGYLKLVSTNNIGVKYAFTIDDNTLRSYFGNLTDEDLVLLRAKMSVLQYFEDANSLFGPIVNIFISRILNDTKSGVEDIADIYGLEIDSNKVVNVAREYINRTAGESAAKELTQDERTVLVSYLNIYMGYKQGGEESISSQIQNILVNSVSGGSQVFALKLN